MADIDAVSIVSWIASGFMIAGGIIPYIPQYAEIWRTSVTEGFSLYVCLTLLIANILRIMFWFGHPFELPLLIQSIVMILAMLAMVQLCTSVKSQSIIPAKSRSLSDFDSRYFWNWTHFSSYVQFILLFTLVAGFLTYILSDQTVFIEILGFLALICEAMLAVPQFYRNLQNQSTKGMSVTMVLMWTAGDLFKTMYFILKRTPLQFWVCGMLQVTLDFAILTQVVYYRSSAPKVI